MDNNRIVIADGEETINIEKKILIKLKNYKAEQQKL